jgi:hypothetical protein
VEAKTATREQLGLLMAGVTPDQVAQRLATREKEQDDGNLQQLEIE